MSRMLPSLVSLRDDLLHIPVDVKRTTRQEDDRANHTAPKITKDARRRSGDTSRGRLAETPPDASEYALPPGWTVRRRGIDKPEFVSPDGLLFTFSVADAWRRYQRVLNRPQSPAEFSSPVDDADCNKFIGEYDSISKELHRLRIVKDMEQYACNNPGKPPVLVYIGAPDGTDSRYFDEAVRLRPALRGARLIAVNGERFTRKDGTQHVTYFEWQTIESYLKTAGNKECSHLWLDTTQTELSTRALWDAHRTTIEKVYIVLSMRKRPNRDDSIMVTRLRCGFLGLTIKHEEAYAGSALENGQSNKINMVLTIAKVDGRGYPEYSDAFDLVGQMVDVPVSSKYISSKQLRHYLINSHNNNEYVVGLVTSWEPAYEPIGKAYAVEFYTNFGELRGDRIYIPEPELWGPKATAWTGTFYRSYLPDRST